MRQLLLKIALLFCVSLRRINSSLTPLTLTDTVPLYLDTLTGVVGENPTYYEYYV